MRISLGKWDQVAITKAYHQSLIMTVSGPILYKEFAAFFSTKHTIEKAYIKRPSTLFTKFFLRSYISSFNLQCISLNQKARKNSHTSFTPHLRITEEVFQFPSKQGLPATQFTPCSCSWVAIYFCDFYITILLWLCSLCSKAALHELRLITYEGLYFLILFTTKLFLK